MTDDYAEMLADCSSMKARLSTWERNFVKSLQAHIAQGRTPTAKQIAVLINIWEDLDWLYDEDTSGGAPE